MRLLAWLGLALALLTCGCAGQQISEPTTALPAPTRNPLTDFHFTTASAGSIVAAPPATPIRNRTADAKFFFINSSLLGMAVFDVEMTQRCIADHRCREQNPLMPLSHAGQLGFNLGLVAGVAGAGYWLKKHRSAFWWLPPATGIAAHTAGVTTGFEHQ